MKKWKMVFVVFLFIIALGGIVVVCREDNSSINQGKCKQENTATLSMGGRDEEVL